VATHRVLEVVHATFFPSPSSGPNCPLSPDEAGARYPEAESDYAHSLADPQITTTRFFQTVDDCHWIAAAQSTHRLETSPWRSWGARISSNAVLVALTVTVAAKVTGQSGSTFGDIELK
jgi:hypothetical protein